MGLLDYIYSTSDTLKRRVRDFAYDPVGYVQQISGLLSDERRQRDIAAQGLLANPSDKALQKKWIDDALSMSSLAPLGMMKINKVVPIMTWPEWQKHFPNILANDSYAMWKSQASNQVEGIAQDLVEQLKRIGVQPSTSGLSEAGKEFTPYAYTNAIGGISSYMNVPGFGEVRISDHLRSSGLGNNRTFGSADDAMSAIKEAFSASLRKQKEQSLLRNRIGITDDMPRRDAMHKLQEWISEQGYKGKDKDLYPWINKLGL